MGQLRVRDADKRADRHALLSFHCVPHDEEVPSAEEDAESVPQEKEELWLLEVEEYVRRYALPTAHHVLLFESESDELTGVTAFNREDVSPSGRRRVAG